MDDLDRSVNIARFRILEALMQEYSKRMPREKARQRLTLLPQQPETRAAALAWFDLRWPQ